jgi:hypothetical protein
MSSGQGEDVGRGTRKGLLTGKATNGETGDPWDDSGEKIAAGEPERV